MKSIDICRPDGSRLCRAEVADNFWTRGVGLLGRAGLAEGNGLLIDPCTSVHTFFMRFALDIVYLDGEGTVLRALSMPPSRMSLGGKGAKKVIELPAATLEQTGLQAGERLQFLPVAA